MWWCYAVASPRALGYTDCMPTITDSMRKLIARDGYNVGETVTCNPDRRTLAYRLDASKGDERWIVGAPTSAVVKFQVVVLAIPAKALLDVSSMVPASICT